MNWKILLLIALIGFGAYQHFSQRPVMHGAGVMAEAQPLQQAINADSFNKSGYTIIPLASFQIEARVLSAEHYSLDKESDLAPVDLALGWGRMSDESILKDISIRQSGRFYYWHVDAFPIPREEIETHSANMHMIPADAAIEKNLKAIRPGQIVNISGWLIEARQPDGWHWRSSLTRNDTGNGACEVVYVKTLSVH